MRRLLLVALLLTACRRRHVPPDAPPVESPALEVSVAEPAAPPPPPPPDQPPPPPQVASARPPDVDAVRLRLAPLWEGFAHCVGAVEPSASRWLQLRFVVLPPTGRAEVVELTGQPAARPCVEEQLKQFRVEPFAGDAVMVKLPLTREGRAVAESELSDGGELPPRASDSQK